MNRNDLKEYFARLKKGHQDEFTGATNSAQKRILKESAANRHRTGLDLNEGMMKNIFGDCQNILFEMAQENGYVCHLCASQALKQGGMGQFNEIDMHLCSQIIEDCILSGLLKADPCPKYPQVTVYFPVLESGDGLDHYTQNIPDVDLDYGSFDAEEDAIDALRNPDYDDDPIRRMGFPDYQSDEDEDTEDDFDLSPEYKRMVSKGRSGRYDK